MNNSTGHRRTQGIGSNSKGALSFDDLDRVQGGMTTATYATHRATPEVSSQPFTPWTMPHGGFDPSAAGAAEMPHGYVSAGSNPAHEPPTGFDAPHFDAHGFAPSPFGTPAPYVYPAAPHGDVTAPNVNATVPNATAPNATPAHLDATTPHVDGATAAHVDATAPHVDATPAALPSFGPGAYAPAQNVHSFEIQNFGDPHVQGVIDGTVMQQIDYMPSIQNFEVFNNTVGGPTAISTHTYNASGDNHITVNHDVTIASGPVGGAAGAGWSLNVDCAGHVALTDAHGTTTLDAAHAGSISETGVTVTTSGDHVLVHQTLQDGGHVDTEIDVHRDGGNVDFKTTGEGNAGLGGWVTQDHHADGLATYGTATFDSTMVV